MGLKLITGPGFGSPSDSEPVSLAEAKAHIRVDTADEDTLITALISAARHYAEQYTGRVFLTQTWDLTLDAFPSDIFEIPKPPLQSVESVLYIDTNGAEQTLAASAYRVDTVSAPGRIAPAYGTVWPTTRDVSGAVTVRFVAGYGDIASTVPQPIRQAILLLIGQHFENREAAIDRSWSSIAFGVDALLAPYRIF